MRRTTGLARLCLSTIRQKFSQFHYFRVQLCTESTPKKVHDQALNIIPSFVPSNPKIEGTCKCGYASVEAKGPSVSNFICHSKARRKASKEDCIPASSFRPENVHVKNTITEEDPSSSSIYHYCEKCKQFMMEDANNALGTYIIPHSIVKDKSQLHEYFKPNYHIFFNERISKAADADSLPKWNELPHHGFVSDGSRWKSPSNTSRNYDDSSGRIRKDCEVLTPTQVPEPMFYTYTEKDPVPSNRTFIPPEKVVERVEKKYDLPPTFNKPNKTRYDVIVIGGGHNGLISAAYLAKAGLDVLVLERRPIIGGAAVTEEIVKGFKFSRASYLAGLLRPQIIKDLQLEKYGFKYIPRNPSSFTPSHIDGPYKGKSLFLGSDENENWKSIAQFSQKDADAYITYESFLSEVRELVQPLLDNPPPSLFYNGWKDKVYTIKNLCSLLKHALSHQKVLIPFYELLTAPASQILDRYFDAEILKATLATDAVIGAMFSPRSAGSAYVLLHHVMGEAAGVKGVWAYVEGGMGSISNAIASSAKDHGAEIAVSAPVKSILYDQSSTNPKATGVELYDGTKLEATKAVFSACTPYHTFLELLPGLSRDSGNVKEISPLPYDFQHHIRFVDYSCGAFKINCAVDKLPDFLCYPNEKAGQAGPQHRGTVHFENFMDEIEVAYREASAGIPATRPVIEMTIPSSLDKTLAPPGKHVVQLFVQYAPYHLDSKIGSWADPRFKDSFADRVFSIVDEFVPGFSTSVIGRDVLSPLDLERIFGLQHGSIHHGALSLHQLFYARPALGWSGYRTPMKQLYMCASGTHPGGGVMGAPGRNAALALLRDLS